MRYAIPLFVALLMSGCNTIIYDRSEATRRSSLELCRLYVHYFQPKTIVDELNLRISRGEFTMAQCREAGDAEEKRQIAEAAGQYGGVAYQLGYAIGSRGRGPYQPSTPPARQSAPMPAPIPVSTEKPLLGWTQDAAPVAGYFMITCRYNASTTVIKVQLGTPCPASVPQ
jgi:hypothetical protein